jgi:GNAT superfamily N-acetyltransferase
MDRMNRDHVQDRSDLAGHLRESINCKSAAVISVRRAIHSDLAVINALIQGSSAYDGKYRAILDGYRVTEEQLDRDYVFVAETAAEVVGLYSLVAAASQPELDLLFVSDGVQGLGVGTALIDHLKSFASSRYIEAIKIVSHPPALGFYLKMGADQVGFVAPSGQVTWERPLLKLRVGGYSLQET